MQFLAEPEFWVAVAFVIFLGVLVYVGVPKMLLDALDDRAKRVQAEFDEARRLARLILSDIIIYHAAKVERGIRENNFFELLRDEIAEGRQYYESRVPKRVLRDSEIFTETLQQFVQMKREEMQRLDTGTNGS